MNVRVFLSTALAFLPLVLSPLASHGADLGERHKPSGMPMRLWLDAGDKPLAFPAYLKAAHSSIAKHRWTIPGETAERRARNVALVSPKEWPARAGCTAAMTEGVLLMHGLTDSPFLMRDLGDFLSGLPSRCFLVRSILLPGHAGSPGDLTVVSYKQWIEAARYGIESFSGHASGVHLAGFSTGGALAVYWAHNPGGHALPVPIRSLMLFSPAIRPTGWFVRLDLVPDFAAWLVEKTRIGEWADVHADQDFAKYESFPLNAGYQIYLLDEELERHAAKPLRMPVFMAQSREDATVNAKDSIDLFLRSKLPSSRMMLVTAADSDAAVNAAAADSRVLVLRARLPGQKVIGFAHTSFVASPGNLHYGRGGDYAECLSYGRSARDLAKYCQCVTPQMHSPACSVKGSAAYVWGERDKKSLEANVLRRLTFNPYFRDMTSRIADFLETAVPR
jgi:alpha-beta hydrolase superfamily lysophospholipase